MNTNNKKINYNKLADTKLVYKQLGCITFVVMFKLDV